MTVTKLPSALADQAVDVLCDAFFEYPVMRFVIGPAGTAYGERLRTLVGFFTAARFLQDDLVMGLTTADDKVVAVANVTLPVSRRASSALDERRQAAWRELGEAARARYEAFGEAYRQLRIDQPHYHLNMIGVRRSHAGQGLARRLLDALHETSLDDPRSSGVTLNTEDPRNIQLYQHFGYRIIGEARVSDELQTCYLFRVDA